MIIMWDEILAVMKSLDQKEVQKIDASEYHQCKCRHSNVHITNKSGLSEYFFFFFLTIILPHLFTLL